MSFRSKGDIGKKRQRTTDPPKFKRDFLVERNREFSIQKNTEVFQQGQVRPEPLLGDSRNPKVTIPVDKFIPTFPKLSSINDWKIDPGAKTIAEHSSTLQNPALPPANLDSQQTQPTNSLANAILGRNVNVIDIDTIESNVDKTTEKDARSEIIPPTLALPNSNTQSGIHVPLDNGIPTSIKDNIWGHKYVEFRQLLPNFRSDPQYTVSLTIRERHMDAVQASDGDNR
ncbi:hypothetical protein Bbelb_187170 [Branchiostoma belcheri]|nr:hypothetical protein Bbelb_187170 [Branchiostoma belcheri]